MARSTVMAACKLKGKHWLKKAQYLTTQSLLSNVLGHLKGHTGMFFLLSIEEEATSPNVNCIRFDKRQSRNLPSGPIPNACPFRSLSSRRGISDSIPQD